MSGTPNDTTHCSSPALGALLEDYLDHRLPQEAAASFEDHYFICGACLAAIELRQQLPRALRPRIADRPPRRARPWAVGAVAAGIAVFALTALVLGRRGPGPTAPGDPVLLTLGGGYRGPNDSLPRAPAGRPLEFVLSVPVPEGMAVTYDVEVLGPTQTRLFFASDRPPHDLTEVRFRLPRGLGSPGRHTVRLVEKDRAGRVTLTTEYVFDLVQDPPREGRDRPPPR